MFFLFSLLMSSVHSGLGLVKIPVGSGLRHQVIMAALLDDLSFIEYDDDIGVLDGGKAMGDDDGRFVLHKFVQSILNQIFRNGIQRAGGFVEYEYGWIFQDGTGDGEPLFLTAGETCAVFTDHGVIAIGELKDELFDVGHSGGGEDLLIGNLPLDRVSDVVPDGSGEEEGFLKHDTDIIPVGV